MRVDLVNLIGRRWFARRWRRQRSACATSLGLDALEQRLALSADPVLAFAPPPPLEIDEPFVVAWAEEVDAGALPSIQADEPAGGVISRAPGTGEDPPPPVVDPTPFGATFRETSEFLIGDVLVSVVLLESDGRVDANTEDWTQSEINSVKSEIRTGLDWWEDTFDLQGSLHDLNFLVDFTFADSPVATRYEPITRSQPNESLWIGDFLNEVDYNSSANRFEDMDRWNHHQRLAHGTDWSFTVFVVDSSVDANGRFSDGHFAYAHLGGPYLVMTYDNNGWGISRMDRVFAHEVGHIFRALDEYPNSRSYTATGGYLNIQNLNAADGHPNPATRTDSLMAEASKLNAAWAANTSSQSSLEMVGWRDSDGNGIFDILDVPLTLTGQGSFDQATGTYRFSGHSSVGTIPNAGRFGPDMTINRVDLLQYRLNGGDWIDGGFYGEHAADVAQEVVISDSGTHTIEFRTVVEQTGLASEIWSDEFSASFPTIVVAPAADLVTSESGGLASFQVMLESQPAAEVSIPIRSSDPSEGVLNTNRLTFTLDNWHIAQDVVVTGMDDVAVDGDAGYLVVTDPAQSEDPLYDGVDTPDIVVTNLDDDVSEFEARFDFGSAASPLMDGYRRVTASTQYNPQLGYGWESGSIEELVSASGTALARDLNATPDGTFVVDVPVDGRYEVAVKIGHRRMWAHDQMGVTLEGTLVDTVSTLAQPSVTVEHAVVVEDGQLTVRLHDLGGFDPNVVVQAVEVSLTASITVGPKRGLITSEFGGQAEFEVVLTHPPQADVTIDLGSDDPGEAVASTSSLRFTPDNWDQPQTVTLTGTDDAVADGARTYTLLTEVAHSEDEAYAGLNAADVTATNLDDDAAGVTIRPVSGEATSESGDEVVFEIVLDNQPTSAVSLQLAADQVTEAVLDRSGFLFTPFNWSIPQTLTVTGLDDSAADGDVTYRIVTTVDSSNTPYAALEVEDVVLINADNEPSLDGSLVQIIDNGDSGFSATSGWFQDRQGYQSDLLAAFAGGGLNTASWQFDVIPGQQYRVSATWLAHPNRATNTPFAVWDGGEVLGAVAVNQELAPDDFTENGVLWEDLGGLHTVTGSTLTVTLSDLGNEFVIADAVRIERIDVAAAVKVTAATTLTTAEGGGVDQFEVVLNTQPTANVTIALASSDPAEGVTDVSSLVFTPEDWHLPQTVTVSGVDDNAVDGDVSYRVITGAAVSADPAYHGLDAVNVAVVNRDDDGPPPPLVPVQVVDNGSSGFDLTGDWDFFEGFGYGFDFHFDSPGGVSASASWTFAVVPGQYRVSATWLAFFNRATNATYTIQDGLEPPVPVEVDQQQVPDGFVDGGTYWEDLGGVFNIDSNTLTVSLSNVANGIVVADAVRIERVGDLLPSSAPAGGPEAPAGGLHAPPGPVLASLAVRSRLFSSRAGETRRTVERPLVYAGPVPNATIQRAPLLDAAGHELDPPWKRLTGRYRLSLLD